MFRPHLLLAAILSLLSVDLQAQSLPPKGSGSELRVLYFTAAACAVCREFEAAALSDPWLNAQRRRLNWRTINLDRFPQLARRWQIQGVPELLVIDQDGDVRGRFKGVVATAELSAGLSRLLDVPSSTTRRTVSASRAQRVPPDYRSGLNCWSQAGYGPFPVESQATFQALRLSPVPRSASVLAPGFGELRLGGTMVNEWAADNDEGVPQGDPGQFQVDYEALQSRVSLRVGLVRGLELEAAFHNRQRFGGRMDSAVDGFHELFNLADNGREYSEPDQVALILRPAGEPAVEIDSKGSYAQDLTLSLRRVLSCGDAKWPALTLSGTARIRTEDDGLLAGGDVDAGVSVELAKRQGDFHLHLNVSYIRFGADSLRGIALQDAQLGALGAVEWRFARFHSAIFQWLYTDGAAKHFKPFANSAHELVFGWRGQLSDQLFMELAGIENIVTLNNSADVGGHLAFSWRW